MGERNEALMRNMSFTLEAMASMPSSRTLRFEDGSFFLSTGTEAASENWAFVPVRSPEESRVKRGLEFFEKLRLPFIWPVLPGADAEYAHLLENAGLALRGHLAAMACGTPFSFSSEADVICREIESPAEVCLWAETAWRAFDSLPGAPLTFLQLAQGFFANGSFVLLIARRGDRPAGTCMLSFSGTEAGVYYFATLPEMRRSGVGNAMMDAIFQVAARRSIELVTLQATPAGFPFYASRGFENLFEIPVYSATSDVF